MTTSPPAVEPPVPGGILRFFFREAIRRVWIAKRTSFVAIGMIAISLLTLGVFLLASENLQHALDVWQGGSRVTIYLKTSASPESISAIEATLRSKPEFSTFKFVSREAALAKFKRYFSNLGPIVDQLDENPFPASFEVEVTRAEIMTPGFNRDLDALRKLDGVDDVQFDWEMTSRVRNFANILNAVGLVAGGILAIAAIFTIANVIRLTMVLYRDEIEIMRLVGATERIIRGPFLLEGVLQGTAGALIAVVLLFGLFIAARQLVSPSTALVWNFLLMTFLPWQKIVALIAAGVAAGLAGSWLSVRGRSANETVAH